MEYKVTSSAMNDAASNISNYTEQYIEQAALVYQAAQTLSEAWLGDASVKWADNMEQLNNWMKQMAEVLGTYSAALKKAAADYESADVTAAKNF